MKKNEATFNGMLELNGFQPYTKETVFKFNLKIPDYLIEGIKSMSENQKFGFALSEKNESEKNYLLIRY
jgi:hypothetical protein